MNWHSVLPKDKLSFRDLVSFHALRRWRLVVAGCLGFLALSLLSWFMITRREEPKVDMPALNVVIAYPGASPEDVETQVIKPLEEVLFGMERVKSVDSSAIPSAATFRMELEEGVNIDVIAEKVRGKIQGKKQDLPVEVKDPEIEIESNTQTPQMLFAVLGFASDSALSAESKRIKAELLTVPGVSGVDLRGDQKPAIRIQVDPLRLASHGVSVDQVVRSIQGVNARVPGGNFEVSGFSTLLQVNQNFADAESVRKVPVAASTDGRGASQVVALGDVADITDSTLKPHQHFLYQNQPGVSLEVRFRGDADAVGVGDAIRHRIGSMETSLPKGLSLVTIHDQPRWISKSVNGFVSSLLEGMILVMIVVTLGMGWRPALVVSGVIPLAAGGAVFGLMLLGFSLEMISISGLIVALGLLVDDAVVETESVQLMRDKGLSPTRSAVLGTARVFWANNGTTAVAIVSFLPLFFMGGDIGQFIRGLPAAVMLSLAISLLVAQVVTPWLSTLLLRKRRDAPTIADDQDYERSEDRTGGEKEERNRALAFLRRLYARWIPWVVRHPAKVTLGASALLAASLALFPVIGFQFFPKSDKPVLFVSVELPKGTNLESVTNKVQEVTSLLKSDPAVMNVSAVAGGGYPHVVGDRNAPQGESLGDIMVRLKDGQETGEAASRMRKTLQNVVGAKLSVDEIWMGPPVSHPILVRVYGDEYPKLRSIAEEIKGRLKTIPGTVNITDSLTDSVPLTQVRIDADKAMRRGILPATAGQTLRWLYGEDKVTEFRRGDDLVQVVLDGKTDPARPYGSLEDTPLPGSGGQMVPLREAGEAKLGFGYAQLQRRNGRRIVEIAADVNADVLPDKVLGELDPWLKGRKWESGYGFVYAGEQEEVGESFRNLSIAAAGALIGIAILLLLMFDDFVLAGLVVLMVPFALIGALTGLALTGNPFGFMAFLGLIALVGVFVNHKIYFIDRMLELLRRGDDLETAILHAGQDRLRPVVLTALTAVLGLVPLTLEGGPMWSGFGWVNIFGLMASIPLSLLLLPAFIVLAFRMKNRFRSVKES